MSNVAITLTKNGHDAIPQGPQPVPQFPSRAFAITPGDVYDHPIVVYVGVTGDVEVIPYGGDTSGTATAVLFKNVPQGSVVPCRVLKVVATNTTATNLVGLI